MTQKKVPKELDAIVDKVLGYRPRARSKPAVQRKRRRTLLRKAKPFYCASCHEEFASREGMYQDAKGLWQHDEEGWMSCCGPVLEKEK